MSRALSQLRPKIGVLNKVVLFTKDITDVVSILSS